MVGRDDDERVDVREHVRQQQVGHGHAIQRWAQQRERRGQQQEAEEYHRAHYALDEIERPGVPFGGEGGREEHVGQRERLVRLLLVDDGAILAHLCNLELLVRVGRIVVPLPHSGEEGNGDVLERARQRDVTHHLEVALHKVRVARLAQTVVVQVVVLDVPRFGQHPIEPVAHAPEHGAHRKAVGSVATLELVGVLAVVPAMADVVPDHRPARARPRAQTDDREQPPERRRHPHGGNAHATAQIGPQDHALQVLHVRLALLIAQSLAQLMDFLAEARVVKALRPLVVGLNRLAVHKRRRNDRVQQARARGHDRALRQGRPVSHQTQQDRPKEVDRRHCRKYHSPRISF